MEKIKEFLKNKSIGYYIVAGIAALSLIFSIIFFITIQGDVMPHGGSGSAPETIGIFSIAGCLVALAVLVIPQYRFLILGSVAMFGLAMYKELMFLPNLLADEINNVHYQGGNFGVNLFYFFTILILIIAGIVATFLGFYKDDVESANDMKIEKGNVKKIGIVSGAGAVALAAILVASIVSNNLAKAKAVNVSDDDDVVVFNPITPDIEAIADAYEYDVNADEVVVKEKESYTFSEASSVPTDGSRTGVDLIYVFEGAYAEGYQGDYSETYASMYLWSDGKFGGSVGGTAVRGFWYNSSLKGGQDDGGQDIQDCLNLVSNVSKYESIICTKASGFYEWKAHIYLGFSWGTRSMEVCAYRYYPVVAIAIDPSIGGTEFVVGQTFDRDGWVADRILKNLNYSAVFKASEVKWTDDENLKNKQKIEETGDYEITAEWNNLKATITVHVSKPAKAGCGGTVEVTLLAVALLGALASGYVFFDKKRKQCLIISKY